MEDVNSSVPPKGQTPLFPPVSGFAFPVSGVTGASLEKAPKAVWKMEIRKWKIEKAGYSCLLISIFWFLIFVTSLEFAVRSGPAVIGQYVIVTA